MRVQIPETEEKLDALDAHGLRFGEERLGPGDFTLQVEQATGGVGDRGRRRRWIGLTRSGGELDRVQGECVTLRAVLSRKDLSVDPSFGKIPALACGFRGASVGEGTLWMETTATNAEEGELDYAEGNWSVRSIRRFEGSSIPSGSPVGYEIRKRDRVIGAVETINHGRVWMDPSLNEKEQARLAAAATALLLYEPPE